jgi:hypothetical protein
VTGFGPGPLGANEALNITVPTIVKGAPGTLYSVSVVAGSGSTPGAIYDSTTASGNGPAELVAEIPAAITDAPIVFDWHCLAGIVIVPPSGFTVAVSFL